MMILARIGRVFNSVFTELQRKGPPRLLHSNSSAEAPTLARSNSVIVYFVPLQLSPNSYWPEHGVEWAQFHVDHNILDNVLIERPSPNEDVTWVEGEGNHIPIQTWLIYQARLKFSLSPLLKEREGKEFTTEDLLHVYCVVGPKKDPKTQMYTGNHYLQLRKPNQPQTSSSSKSYIYFVLDSLAYLPSRFDCCRIQCQIKVSDLIEGAAIELVWPREEAKGLSMGSSRWSSSDLFGFSDKEVSEEATSEKATKGQGGRCRGRRWGSLGSSSEEEVGMVSRFNLGKKKDAGAKPYHSAFDPVLALPSQRQSFSQMCHPLNKPVRERGSFSRKRKVTNVDSSRDHETYLALENAIMFPQDVANLAIEGSEEFKYMLIKQGIQPADEEGVAAIEVGTTQGNDFMGGEVEIADEGERKKARGAKGKGIDEGNPNIPPTE
ncbi:hypothetical protein Acr_00g0028250 [Actinidia rufa]|uniref:Uncharacterized protein n=1 Tax=Actinidia rufa TaxID=165716 RepID=A0A7J0DG43_9ERIC|nr:hypothetical protein Acr_00g0028250 [Actinidia rufa]